MVISSILEYVNPGEIINNKKFGSGFEVTPDRKKHKKYDIESQISKRDVISFHGQLQKLLSWALCQIIFVVN